MKYNAKGFTAVSVLLILIILVLVGGAGYMVYKSQGDTKSANTQTSSSSAEHVSKTDEEDFIKSIQEDGSVLQVNLSKVAKPTDTDKITILELLHAGCADKSDKYITVNYKMFQEGNVNSVYIQDDGHVRINASVCGLSGSPLLHKDNAGIWVYDGKISPMGTVSCSFVDGKGYPASVLPACTDDTSNSERAPR